jgi:hypothetical protein
MPFQTGTQDQDNSQVFQDMAKFFIQPEDEMEPNPSTPEATPRGTGLLQIPGNAVHNIADLTQGLGVAGSIVGARALEALPSISDSGDFQMGQSILRLSDADDIGRVVDATFNQYNENYIKPLLEGRLDDIYKYAARNPVDVGLDVLSVAGPAAKFTRAGELLDKTGLVKGIKDAGTGLVGKVEKIVEGNADLAPHLERLKAKQEAYNIRSARDQALADDLKMTLPELQRAYAAVPKEYHPHMRNILEGSHPEVLLNGYTRLPKEVNAYRELLQGMTERRLEHLKQLGIVTDESATADRFKPMLSEYLNTVKGAKKDVNALSKEEIQALTAEASEYAKSKGITPVYQMRGTDAQIGKIIADPLNPPEWLHRLMKNRTAVTDPDVAIQKATLKRAIKHAKREAANALTLAEKRTWQASLAKHEAELKGLKQADDSHAFGLEMQRSLVQNEAVSSDALKVAMASEIQTAQAYHTYNAFLHAAADKAIPVSKLTPAEKQLIQSGKLAVFDPAEFFGQFEFGEKLLQDLFPEPVAVPKAVISALDHLRNWKRGSYEKLLAGFANFARRYVLGYNLLFPEKQQLQNWFMLGMTQFNGPRDTLLSFASYAMANNKEIQRILPAALMAEQFGAEAAAPGRSILGKASRAFEAIPDQTFARSQVYDRYTRAAAAIYYGLKVSEEDAQLGKILTGIVGNGEAINRLQNTFSHPEMVQRVAKQIEITLGDYSALKSSQRAGIRSCLLWWLWYEHIVKFTASLTQTNPMKLPLMRAITRTYPELFQADMEEGQLKEAGGVMVKDRFNPQGMPLATMSGGMNPFTTVGELVEMMGQPFSAKAASSFLGASNPIFTIAAFAFGVNPQTGTGFRDPNMVSLGGRQYRPEDIALGRLVEQRPMPDKLEYLLKTFFPAPTRTAERLFEKYASGGEPSQFTSAITAHSAPRKAFGAHGAPLEAQSLFDTIAQSILGYRAVPIDTESARKQKLLEHKRLAQAYRAMMLQHGESPY